MIAMDSQSTEPAPPPAAKNSAEVTRQKRIKNASRWADDTSNACIKESQLSLKCIMDNDFDRDKCALFFQNYRNCLDFWKRVFRDRRRAGIQPAMPPAEEREAIKAEYYRRSQAQMKN